MHKLASQSPRETAPSGLLVVDKPLEWTSHDVVARTRRLAGTKKVGHAGTLDPQASGVLVMGVGAATRFLTYLVGLDKQYETVIRLGAATSTDDAAGEVLSTAEPAALLGLSDEMIAGAVGQLTGNIMQVPSAVSAIKIDGVRAYARARAGEDVDLPARPVTVSSFVVTRVDRGADFIDVSAVIDCSSGTYIRALGRDLGAALGVGGHLAQLRRTRVGQFGLDASHDFSALVTAQESGELTPKILPVIPLGEAARQTMPWFTADADQELALRRGQQIDRSIATITGDDNFAQAAALNQAGELIAVVAPGKRSDALRPVTGFPAP